MTDEITERSLDKLRRDLGEDFLRALNSPDTVEIFLNADGQLWVEELGKQMRVIGFMTPNRAMGAMNTLASFHYTTITRMEPSLECELPLDGSRFAGQIPPLVTSPTFCVRKRASFVYRLSEYVEEGIMTWAQHELLVRKICDHRNILVSGATGSGKTTLLNGLIHELTQCFPQERLVIIEDTLELQCAAKNYVQLHTSPTRNMTSLVRHSLRMRPNRLLIGEVRGPEALDMLMSWNTGHQGGFATVHANSALDALSRLETLVSMHSERPEGHIEGLIGAAVNVIVHIARTEKGRIVQQIIEVSGWDKLSQKYSVKELT